MKQPKFKCTECKDTGKVKYIPIQFSMYSWQPWLEKECSCQKKENKTQIPQIVCINKSAKITVDF